MSTDEKLDAILAAVQTDPGNRGLARPAIVNREDLWINRSGRCQRQCQALVVPASGLGRKVRDHRLPDSIVIGLDLFVVRSPEAPDQPR